MLRNEYEKLHSWLRETYGKANHCENCNSNTEKRFEWVLKKGYEYEYNVNNYTQLCRSCHRKQDNCNNNFGDLKGEKHPLWGKHHTEETKNKIRKTLTGIKHSEERKQNQSNARKGKKHKQHKKHIIKIKRLSGKNNPLYGKKWKTKKIQCPFCNLTGGIANMKRYHFNNCKYKNAIF
jgi:hypothetical protein